MGQLEDFNQTEKKRKFIPDQATLSLQQPCSFSYFWKLINISLYLCPGKHSWWQDKRLKHNSVVKLMLFGSLSQDSGLTGHSVGVGNFSLHQPNIRLSASVLNFQEGPVNSKQRFSFFFTFKVNILLLFQKVLPFTSCTFAPCWCFARPWPELNCLRFFFFSYFPTSHLLVPFFPLTLQTAAASRFWFVCLQGMIHFWPLPASLLNSHKQSCFSFLLYVTSPDPGPGLSVLVHT